MREVTITTQETLVTETCASCGVIFAMPAHFAEKRRETGDSFHCPNGHSLVYQSELRKLRAQLDAEQTRVKRLREEVERERKRHAATKGELTKMRKRAGAGVCPCCKRSFVALARHVASKHPDFDPAAT